MPHGAVRHCADGGHAAAFLTPMLKFFGATPDVLPYAEAYTRITALGFPFLIANTGMSKLILADGSRAIP